MRRSVSPLGVFSIPLFQTSFPKGTVIKYQPHPQTSPAPPLYPRSPRDRSLLQVISHNKAQGRYWTELAQFVAHFGEPFGRSSPSSLKAAGTTEEWKEVCAAVAKKVDGERRLFLPSAETMGHDGVADHEVASGLALAKVFVKENRDATRTTLLSIYDKKVFQRELAADSKAVATNLSRFREVITDKIDGRKHHHQSDGYLKVLGEDYADAMTAPSSRMMDSKVKAVAGVLLHLIGGGMGSLDDLGLGGTDVEGTPTPPYNTTTSTTHTPTHPPTNYHYHYVPRPPTIAIQ